MREFARLPQPPERGEMPSEEHSAYDRVVQRTNSVHGLEGQAGRYFGALLNSPPLAAALTELGTQVRLGGRRGTYTDVERELMDIALAVELGSSAILPIHIPDAVAVGVRLDAIEAIMAGRDDELEREERQLVNYARRYVRGTVDDDAYATIRGRFGDRGAVEFNVLLGFLLMTIRLWAALGVPEPTNAELAAQIDDIRNGRVDLPDPDARIG